MIFFFGTFFCTFWVWVFSSTKYTILFYFFCLLFELIAYLSGKTQAHFIFIIIFVIVCNCISMILILEAKIKTYHDFLPGFILDSIIISE